MNKHGKNDFQSILLVVGVIAVVFIAISLSGSKNLPVEQSAIGAAGTPTAGVLVTKDITPVAATVTPTVYDAGAASKSAASINLYYSRAANAATIGNHTSGSALTSIWSTGDKAYFGTDSAAYYLVNDVNEFTIDTPSVNPSIDAWAAATESSMSVNAFDSNNQALTAHTNSTLVDYTYTLGASTEKYVDVTLAPSQAYKMFRLGAICTFARFNTSGVEDYKVSDTRFKEVSVPLQLKNAVISVTNPLSGTAITLTGYERCYVPVSGNSIDLKNSDDIRIKTWLKTGLSNPVANGNNYVGLLFVDYGCNTNKNNVVECGFFRNDDNARVTEVGIDETETSPQGLTSGVLIEIA